MKNIVRPHIFFIIKFIQLFANMQINIFEDFNKPKIIYPNMTKFLPFVYDDKGFYPNPKCYILTGEKLFFLTAFFNSSLFKYCFRESFLQLLGDTRELQKRCFDKIPVIQVDEGT